MAHVLMTTSSGVSSDAASAQPADRSRPAIASESLRFIWQPSVQTWNRGSAGVSGRYSARRTSAGSGGLAGAVGAGGGRAGGRGGGGGGGVEDGGGAGGRAGQGHRPRMVREPAPWPVARCLSD